MTLHAIVSDPISIPISDTSQVGEARRAAQAIAQSMGFDDVLSGQIGIVATELASNIVRHAKSGEVVLRSIAASETASAGFEILAIDRGPGIANLGQAFADGFSTGGTPGTGLGAAKRLSANLDIFTEPEKGTVVRAQFGVKPLPAVPVGRMEVGAVCVPLAGETACGDAWAMSSDSGGRTVLIIADGLGHGIEAARASNLAIQTFRTVAHQPASQIITAIHAALRSTRGAAVAVAELFRNRRQILFSGVGNISAAIVGGGNVRHMTSHNGTAGVEARRIQVFEYAWPEDSLVVMHSDGLSTHWNLQQHPGLRFRHPGLIAGVLYRDHRRVRDDATVIVLRSPEP